MTQASTKEIIWVSLTLSLTPNVIAIQLSPGFTTDKTAKTLDINVAGQHIFEF